MPPPSLCEKVSTISPDVEQVVTTALAKDPKQRFGSVLAFATALEQASQVKRPEPVPIVPVSETTDINQSQQSTEMATPVPLLPFSQQAVSEVPADTSAQPHTIFPLSGKERLRQAEEERRQASSITEFPVPTAGSVPRGITAGPDGNLWFIEFVGNKIGRFTPGK
jgi:hypothetical protein